MMKEVFLKRIFYGIMFLIGLFLISFTFYSYLVNKTLISDLSAIFNAGKNSINADSYTSINALLSNLSTHLTLQILVYFLLAAGLLFVLGLLFKHYIYERISSRVDVLTQVYSRRAILDILKKNIENSIKYGGNLCIAVVDIDYFKNYNDFNGHILGDSALRKIAKIFKKNLRTLDYVGRIGGEEFLFIFPKTRLETAVSFCEKLRLAVQKANFKGMENLPNKFMSISVGVCELDRNSVQNSLALIDKADKLLYYSKETGRNRVNY